MRDIKSALNPNDIKKIDATAQQNWIPKEPRELLYSYLEEEDAEASTELDKRRDKANQVYDGYNELAKKANELKQKIALDSKDIKITLNPSNNNSVITAVRRVFGTDGKQITFQMYQEAIATLSKLSKQGIPTPQLRSDESKEKI